MLSYNNSQNMDLITLLIPIAELCWVCHTTTGCRSRWTLVLPSYTKYRRLQSVMNAAARSIAGLRRSDHITDTLASLHWLRSSERIQYKLAMTVFRSLHGLAPYRTYPTIFIAW